MNINREDMLELTRRMTPSRHCFDRIAGCYIDDEGFIDGTFNTRIDKLKPSEIKKNLDIAKMIPFADTNKEIVAYDFVSNTKEQMKISCILNEIKNSGLKNDALLETFYEILSEKYNLNCEYGIYLFHGVYDVPRKAMDKEWIEGSEEVYEFIICAISPLTGDYEMGSPKGGFIYPNFSNRSRDDEHIAIYNGEGSNWGNILREILIG